MEQNKRKDWIKNVIIVFLLIVLLLTLFSNTITNYTLAQVSTGSVTQGSITEVVRGTGNVEASDPYTVMATESRQIDAVLVSKGDHVNIGDTIINLSDIESAELQKAESELQALEDEYYSAMFTTNASAENIAKARSGHYDTLASLQAELAEIEKELEEAQIYWNDCKNQTYVMAILVAVEKNDVDIDSLGLTQAKALIDAEVTKLTLDSEYYPDDESIKEALYKAKKKQAELLAASTIDAKAVTIEQSTIELEKNKAENVFNAADAHLTDVKNKRTELINRMADQVKLESKAEAITKKQKEIEILQAKSTGTTITAPVSGIVQNLTYVSGEKMESGKAICTIIPDGKDMLVKFSVKSDQAKKVSVGSQAEISNAWYYADSVSFLRSITDDPDNAGKSVLTFTISGSNITIGQSVTLSIGSVTKNYDLIVPKAAIKSDNSGKYVYVLINKSSPLGNRYYAEKRAVQVQAEDDTKAAVSGDLSVGDYVITTSNKMIESGKQVRLSESSAN